MLGMLHSMESLEPTLRFVNQGSEMGEKWSSLNQEEEAQHRQTLLRKARKGDEKAKLELLQLYRVRVWSEKERAKLIYINPPSEAKRGKRKANNKS